MSGRRILRGARLLPLEGRRQVKRLDLVMDGGRIAVVGGVPAGPRDELEETRAIVIPALVNAYVQLDQTLLDRGFVPDVDPWRFYGVELPEWRKRLDDDALAISARAAIARGLLSGTTVFGDVGRTLARGASLAAATDLGARIVAMIDARAPEPERALDTLAGRIADGAPASLALFAGDAERVPQAVLAKAARVARERSLPLVTRLGLLPGDRGGLAALERAGALQKGLAVVHARGESLGKGGIAALAAAGASVIVTPAADLLVGAPPPPVHELLAAGINVALGSDTGAARAQLDLFRDLRLLHGLLRGRVEGPASAALEIATRGGARALGVGTGAIEVGQRADLVALDLPLGGEDHESLALRVVEAGGRAEIGRVWIAGEPAVGDGRLLRGGLPDEEEEQSVRDKLPRFAPTSWADRLLGNLRGLVGVDRGWYSGRLPYGD